MYKSIHQRKIRPVLRFSLDGKKIARFDDSVILRHSGFDTSNVNRCTGGKRLKTYKDSIWILEEEYTEELLKKRLDMAKNKKRGIKPKPVMSFDSNGKLVKRYTKISDEEIEWDGYQPSNVGACCRGKLMQHGDLIWMFEEEYTEELLKKRVDALKNKKRISKWRDVIIGRYTSDSVLMDTGTIEKYVEEGYNRDQLYRCLNGITKLHKGFNFRVINERI